MEVKWIKLATNIFDNRKIKQIETLPEGDSIIIMWIKLLCLAGNINDNGYIYFTKEIPYTDQMLANQFNMSLPTVQLGLRTFEHFNMIDVVDDIMMISNWEKYQSVDKMNDLKEYNRIKQRESRERRKVLTNSNVNDMSMTVNENVNTDKNKNKNKNKNNISLAQSDLENHSMPPVITITLNDKSEYPIYQSDVDKWQELYQSVDVMQEFRKMKGWAYSNITKRKTKNGIKRFINGWLAREQDSYHSSPSSKKTKYDIEDMNADEDVDLVARRKELFGE